MADPARPLRPPTNHHLTEAVRKSLKDAPEPMMSIAAMKDMYRENQRQSSRLKQVGHAHPQRPKSARTAKTSIGAQKRIKVLTSRRFSRPDEIDSTYASTATNFDSEELVHDNDSMAPLEREDGSMLIGGKWVTAKVTSIHPTSPPPRSL